MKKTILFILSLFSLFAGYSQSGYNLEFNQAKLIGNTTETVPANKVWKITNVLPELTNSNSSVVIKVNGNNIEVISNNKDQNANSPISIASLSILSGAIWLPALTTLQTGSNCKYISVIEFNKLSN